jgi:hypothetical protein
VALDGVVVCPRLKFDDADFVVLKGWKAMGRMLAIVRRKI